MREPQPKPAGFRGIFDAVTQDAPPKSGDSVYVDRETKNKTPWQRTRERRTNLRHAFWNTLPEGARRETMDKVDRSDYGDWFQERIKLIRQVRSDWDSMQSFKGVGREAYDKIPTAILLDFARSDLEDNDMLLKVRAYVGFKVKEEAQKRYDALSDGQKARADRAAHRPAAFEAARGQLAPGEEFLPGEERDRAVSLKNFDRKVRTDLPEIETAQLASVFGFSSKSVQNAVADTQGWLTDKILNNAVMDAVVKISEAPARALDYLAQQATGEDDITIGQAVFGKGNALSGTADAAKVFFLDTFVVFGKLAKFAKSARGLNRIDDMKDIVKGVERGINSAPVDRFAKWWTKLPDEMRTVGYGQRNAEMYGWKVSAEAWDDLSKAKNADEVKNTLSHHALGGQAGEQGIEALPYLRPTHHVRRAWEGGQLGKMEFNNPMLGPFRSTWGHKLDPSSPVFEKQLRRFGDFMWGVKNPAEQAARTVDGHVGRITRISDKATRTKAMGTMLDDGLQAFAIRHGATPEEAATALKAARNANPRFGARSRQVAYGVTDTGSVIDQPFRQTQLANSIPVPSYMDLLTYKTEILDAMGKSGRAGARRSSKAVGDAFAVATRGVIRIWLAKPSTLVRAAVEESLDLAGHPEFGRIFRRQQTEDLLDYAGSLLHRGHPRRADTAEGLRRELHASQGYRGHAGMAATSLSDDVAQELAKAADDLDIDLFHWKAVDATDPTFSYAWYHVVNHQVMQDPLSQIIVAYGDDLDSARQMGKMWLDTPEGQKYLRNLPNPGGERAAAFVLDEAFAGAGVPNPNVLRKVAPKSSEYLYHYSPAVNEKRIAKEGLRPSTPFPGEPTGVYFADNGEDVFLRLPTRKNTKGMLVRVKAADVPTTYRGGVQGGERYASEAVAAERLEYLGADEAWHPIAASKTDTILDWHINDIQRNIPAELMPVAQGAAASGGKISLDDFQSAFNAGKHPDRVVGPVPISQLPADEAARLGYHHEMAIPVGKRKVRPGQVLTKPYGWGATVVDALARRPGFKAAKQYRREGLERLSKTRVEYGAPPIGEETLERLSTHYANREMWRMDNPLERARSDFWLRNVSPFQYNQNNFMKRWGRKLVNNPGYVSRLRNMEGAMEDVGFIQKDENGNLTFVVPIASEFYTNLIKRRKDAPKHYRALAFSLGYGAVPSGVGAFKKAPFDAFSQLSLPPGMPFAASVEPGFGPIITIPVAALTAHKPKMDWARNLFLGGFETWNTDVGWFNNLAQTVGAGFLRDIGVVVSGGKGDRAFLGTVRDMAAYAEMTGKDIFDPKVQKQLEGDAKWFFAVRAVTKYLFPYAVSSPIFMEERDELQKMMDELGPEEATAKFLEKYEGKGFAMLTAITEGAAAKGNEGKAPAILLAPTGYAEKFFRENPDFFSEFPNVAGLFTNRKGDKFDPAAFKRQQLRGQRISRNLKESPLNFWLALNIEAGTHEYFDKLLPQIEKARAANIDDTVISGAKKAAVNEIDKLFPGTKNFLDGWSARRGQKDQAIAELKEAVTDPRVSGRSDVKALKTFLSYYERADAAAKAEGYVALGRQKGTAVYRGALVATYKQLQEQRYSAVLEKAYTYLFRADLEDEDEEEN